jgi:hypothetical protein
VGHRRRPETSPGVGTSHGHPYFHVAIDTCARRRIRATTLGSIGGRPGHRLVYVQRRVTRRRCQRSSARAARRSWASAFAGAAAMRPPSRPGPRRKVPAGQPAGGGPPVRGAASRSRGPWRGRSEHAAPAAARTRRVSMHSSEGSTRTEPPRLILRAADTGARARVPSHGHRHLPTLTRTRVSAAPEYWHPTRSSLEPLDGGHQLLWCGRQTSATESRSKPGLHIRINFAIDGGILDPDSVASKALQRALRPS